MTEYVLMPGAHYQDICNALREKTGDTQPIRSGEISSQIAGLSGDQHYDFFWDNYQTSLNGNYSSAFGSAGWTDDTYNPKYMIVCNYGNAEMAFRNAKITNTKVPIEVRVASAGMMFSNCTNLKTVPFLGLFGVTNTGSIFSGCYALEDVTFGGEIQTGIGLANSSKLSTASVQSLLDHIKDMEGLTSPKLTLHATVGEKLTEEQKAVITSKNWTLVY